MQRIKSWTNWKSAFVIVTLCFGSQQAIASSNLIVETNKGPVQGVTRDSVVEYRGIPYAEPPVGDLRWKPPVEHAAWKEVRDATSFGKTCAQVTLLGVFAGPANTNEDCLYLNMTVPKT